MEPHGKAECVATLIERVFAIGIALLMVGSSSGFAISELSHTTAPPPAQTGPDGPVDTEDIEAELTPTPGYSNGNLAYLQNFVSSSSNQSTLSEGVGPMLGSCSLGPMLLSFHNSTGIGVAPLWVSFSAEIECSATVTWNWGDGNQSTPTVTNHSVTIGLISYNWWNYTHTYHYNGDFVAAFSTNGLHPIVVRTNIYVSTVGEVSFRASPTFGTPPLGVSFSYETFYGRGYSDAWSFGDGNATTQTAPNGTASHGNLTYQWWNYTHTYHSAGAFLVQVNVSLSKFYAVASTTENVAWAEAVSFSGTPNFGGAAPLMATFTFESEYAVGYSASWIFGDGNSSVQGAPNGTATGSTASYQWWNYTHTFQYVGAFNTSVTVTKSGHQASGWTLTYASFVPSLFYSFYNESGLLAKGLTGTGESIGLVEGCGDGTTYTGNQTDLDAFDTRFELPTSTINWRLPEGSCPSTGSGWNPNETSLDIEWAHVAAPKATIYVCLALSTATSSVEGCVSYFSSNWKSLGLAAVSVSAGNCAESTIYDGSGSDISPPCLDSADPYNSTYYSMYSAGMTVLVSTGDEDSSICSTANYDSADPYVIAVGGTTVSNVNNLGLYGSEKQWFGDGKNDYACRVYNAGTKQWAYFPADLGEMNGTITYYKSLVLQNAVLHTVDRYFPDVSMVANASTGVPIVSWNEAWFIVGGTSVGAPVWAGILATLLSAEAPGLSGFAGQFLYSGAAQPCFHFISNATARDGLGTPNVGCLSTV